MSKRYLEIYSGRRNRQQYPSPANFVIPFGTSSEVKDPILNGAIYYQSDVSTYLLGSVISATNTGTLTLKADQFFQLSEVIDAYKGLTLTIYPPSNQGNMQSQIILTYNPSTYTVTVESGFFVDPTGSGYMIVPNNTVVSGIVSTQIPYEDKLGNQILNEEQGYINYYLMDETLSNGSLIVAKKIYYYNYNTRTAYTVLGEKDDPSYIPQNISLRKSLPEEKWTIVTPTYINTDPSHGPLGPVITLPAGASPVDNYYVGKYVYFVSNRQSSQIETKFKPVYGVFYIKAYKAISMDVNELFVDYDQNDRNLLPLPIFNEGVIEQAIKMGGGGDFFLQLSNVTPETGSTFMGLNIIVYGNVFGDGEGINAFYIKSIGYSHGNYGIFFNISGFAVDADSFIGLTYTIKGDDNVINIVSLQRDNATNLDYIGTMVSVNQAICYDIELIELILPNTPLLNGTIVSTYPFVYVHLKNVSSPTGVSPSTIYSNNPPSTDALFVVLITDITDPTTSKFVRIKCSTTVRVKFKPNDSLHFSVTLPDGSYVTPAQPDYFSPYEPNPELQIHATFGIKPI